MSPCCTGFPDVRLGTDELINLSKYTSCEFLYIVLKVFVSCDVGVPSLSECVILSVLG